MFGSHRGFLTIGIYHHRVKSIQINTLWCNNEKAHDSQIVRAKENFIRSHGGPSYKQASDTNPMIKALSQSRHWVCDLSHSHTIKEEIIASNRDWVDNQAYRLSHDIQIISNIFYNVQLFF